VARVLIAEPSADVRALLARAVRRVGHEVLELDPRAPEPAPDADVLLLEPACANGLAAARALRARSPGLPIVICSIFPPRPDLLHLGAIAHVVKPFDRQVLEQALQDAAASASRDAAGGVRPLAAGRGRAPGANGRAPSAPPPPPSPSP
jgi:CheY-like chemotaxis protein